MMLAGLRSRWMTPRAVGVGHGLRHLLENRQQVDVVRGWHRAARKASRPLMSFIAKLGAAVRLDARCA